VGIVGLGAVGASIGLALNAAGRTTIGMDTSPENLSEALRIGAISRRCRRPEDLGSCRTIFVAVSPGAVVEVSRALLDSTGATVVDVASVKSQIARAISSPRFVPSHPLAGTHLSGPAGARRDLFQDATWLVCPTRSTSRTRLIMTENLIRTMGAEPLRMDPDEHDAVLASTSHLPHVAASGLVHVLAGFDPSVAGRLVGTGFLDTTRIARSNPNLWADITLHNRTEVSRSIGEMVDRLQSVGRAISEGNREGVLAFFADACRLMEDSLPAARPPAPATTRVISFQNSRVLPAGAELGGVH
jgi:prephenate dehydrogenase